MMTEPPYDNANAISFLNRDHVVLFTVTPDEVSVIISLGFKISVRAPRQSLSRFVDDLANHVESNFVSVSSAEISLHERASTTIF